MNHISIDLPTFLDFCVTTGPRRVSIVRDASELQKEPRRVVDFYDGIRKAIRDMHAIGANVRVLDVFLHAQTDDRKRRIYPSVIEGHRKFLNDQGPRVTWWAPPEGEVRYGDVQVHVAPELGLALDGEPYLLALWFGGDRPSATRIQMHLNVLAKAFGALLPGATLALLDVRRAKLHRLRAPNPRTDLVLRGDAASFSTIWEAL